MTIMCRLVFLFGAVGPIMACSAAADAPSGKVRVEAVVQKYEVAALEDLFEDGRFATFDAVALKIVAPPKLADKTIRVYVASGSVADNSPLRKPGRRCRFDFETSLLKTDQLFQGALANVEWIAGTGAASKPGACKTMRPIDPDVLAAIAAADLLNP